MFQLPKFATAPFCPSEVQGTIAVPPGLSGFQKLLRYLGPGLLISVGYMDPGNWATDIAAGSGFGTDLLFVVGLAGLAVLIAYAVRLTFSAGAEGNRFVLGVTFLTGFVYEGIGVGFEDTRHLWVLLGLLAAAASISPADGNNRRSDAPSHC